MEKRALSISQLYLDCARLTNVTNDKFFYYIL